jgi:Tol biopolymer transport system component
MSFDAGRLPCARQARLALAALMTSSAALAQGGITRVSVSSTGQQGNDIARDPAVSSDGRVTAFMFRGTNFDPADTNPDFDVYVHYGDTGQTIWVSQLPDGTAGHFGGYFPSISADGSRVAFQSLSPLVPGDTGFEDVFVRDIAAATTQRVSVALGGGQPDGNSGFAKVSGDGRCVAFMSFATNLIPFDANGNSFQFGNDVFVRDLVTGTTELVHVSSAGVQGDASARVEVELSFDGRFVAFASDATNLVVGDTNLLRDVFVRDRQLAMTERVSVDSNGIQGDDLSGDGGIALSSDGRWIAFASTASNLVGGDTNNVGDIFVHDRATGITERVNVSSNGVQAGPPGIPTFSYSPAISFDGRFIAFGSDAANLVPFDLNGQSDFFVRDRLRGTTHLETLTSSGAQANDGGFKLEMTPDGEFLVFSSSASNLVPLDFNGAVDVFLLERDELSPSVYCTATTSSQSCLASMGWTGTPSASTGSGFDLRAIGVHAKLFGVLLYGVHGPQPTLFAGGILCVRSPKRGPIHHSGGMSGCSGMLSCDFNSFIASGADPALDVGRAVWTQFLSRDPSSASTLNLSDAVFFEIEP